MAINSESKILWRLYMTKQNYDQLAKEIVFLIGGREQYSKFDSLCN